MKSPQLARLGLADDPHYSDLQVMESPAGHYVGTSYRNLDARGKLLFEEPGSRDSGYFASREEAAAFLAELEANQHDLANCEAAAELRLMP